MIGLRYKIYKCTKCNAKYTKPELKKCSNICCICNADTFEEIELIISKDINECKFIPGGCKSCE